MSCRHRCSNNPRTGRVTSLTRFRRALEHALNVTSFTSGSRVGRIEREAAGAEMIKLCSFRLSVNDATRH